ncbi:5-formyltetrahydrofolate cyclo-ligase [Caldisalinibacter kiritimatiensis]|uniref:5-formyltetrahydrofolate cyclo-ligase n=1 Tax=Caldisalinibacter kiritimatiensis TaxID=1304284 RepID=R1AYH0_9FIRM|nr:5-formyltetrahydrofolate cyclo-ligase [Caldisalinibacter kiritimatiensis]EOD01747.1 5-formyltetrahydrofolate cyclo-ligase [Caldisalinibacter kiritimatiensis]
MITVQKEKLRKEILNIRNNMKKSEVEGLSEKIISRLVNMDIFKESKNVMIYLSFKNEVDTYKLLSHCKRLKKNVIVPFTVKEKKEIIPTLLKDQEKELVKSYYGYMEPSKEYLRPVNKEDIDIVIVPGVVFDERCCRIGFGGGYYDRFFSDVKDKVIKVGIAYEFQIVERVPVEEFDVPLDYVITEKRIIRKVSG